MKQVDARARRENLIGVMGTLIPQIGKLLNADRRYMRKRLGSPWRRSRNKGEIHEVSILRSISFGTIELWGVRTIERTESCGSLLDEMLE
jgi:hypothetical protein